MNDPNSTVAIVTGAGGGIGRAIAKRFGNDGMKVVVGDIDTEGGSDTVAEIQAEGGQAVFVETDVTAKSDLDELVETTVEEYGGVDILINNAGIEGKTDTTAEQQLSNWEQIIDVNLRGVFLGMQAAIPAMLEDDGGSIVNISSVAGVVGFAGRSPYVASKHGVIGLTKTAALEFAADGIRVNAVCPGVIETEMIERAREEDPEEMEQITAATPMARLGQPEEIAGVTAWLCSEDASFVTGESVVADGGLTQQ